MIQKPVKVGFAPTDAIGANFGRVAYRKELLDGDGHVMGHVRAVRTDCIVTFVVRHDDNSELETWEYGRLDVPLDFTWINAAFRAEAWAAYLATKGYSEVP